MNKSDTKEWLWRSGACAVLSGLALGNLPHAEQWVPGVAFSLLVVAARSREAGLLAAVVLAYCLGYASGALFNRLDVGALGSRLGVVAVGSALLALSLWWKGGLSRRQAFQHFFLGTLLALPFWQVVDLSYPRVGRGSSHGLLPGYWILAMAVWQMPMAWLYLFQRSRS